jgi:hypothetical protein
VIFTVFLVVVRRQDVLHNEVHGRHLTAAKSRTNLGSNLSRTLAHL